jgi:plasmid maintenance system antidote protein VapI
MRFVVAAANRSLVLSETTLPHAPEIIDGEHFVSTSSNAMIDRILHYLDNEPGRQSIVQNAYDLTTTQLTMENSLRMMLHKVEQYQASTRLMIRATGSKHAYQL